MESLDDVFVADAVTHAYNLAPSNYRYEKYAEQVCEMMLGVEMAAPPAYQRTPETFLTDWRSEVTTNLLFRESQVDFCVFHPQSIGIFEDGLTAEAKAAEFTERHPDRSAPLASVDLIGMDDPVAELERQVEELGAHGVKVYPSYWDDDGHRGIEMDDPETAFPVWEAAADLDLDVVAVHKAVPFGSVPMESYRVGDVDEAADSFPDLNFEIVHGGMAFAEETGWQLGRHPNVYVNLEITAMEAALSPESFVETMEDLLWVGGKRAIDRIVWGSGAPQYHPRLLLEAFWEFDFPEMEWMGGSYTITQDDKRKMLGENLLDAHGFDEEAVKEGLPDDEFADRGDLPEPYSTTDFEVVA
jgi:hypothetical protein